MKSVCRLFSIGILLALTGCIHSSDLRLTNYNTAHENRLMRTVIQACPMIKTEEGMAAGILISADGYIITDIHVTDIDDEVKVIFYRVDEEDNNYIRPYFTTTASVIDFSDPALDWSIIKVKTMPPGVTPLRLAPDGSLKFNQPVWRFGYNESHRLANGYFVAADSEPDDSYLGKRMVIPSGHGASGGPIVNQRGEVLGMVQNGTEGEYRITVIKTDTRKRVFIYYPEFVEFLPVDMIRALINQSIKDNSLKLGSF